MIVPIRKRSKSQASLFAMVKPTESCHTLDRLAEDVLLLTERFTAVPEVGGMQSFKLRQRQNLVGRMQRGWISRPGVAATPVDAVKA